MINEKTILEIAELRARIKKTTVKEQLATMKEELEEIVSKKHMTINPIQNNDIQKETKSE